MLCLLQGGWIAGEQNTLQPLKSACEAHKHPGHQVHRGSVTGPGTCACRSLSPVLTVPTPAAAPQPIPSACAPGPAGPSVLCVAPKTSLRKQSWRLAWIFISFTEQHPQQRRTVTTLYICGGTCLYREMVHTNIRLETLAPDTCPPHTNSTHFRAQLGAFQTLTMVPS